MAATKHEDVEIQTKNAADASELNKNAVSLFLFFFQSVVVAALFPIVLRWCGRDMLMAVWMLSLLLCSYFYSAVYVFSAATRRDKARLFIFLTSAASFAMVVDAVLSHAAGTAIMYLDSVWMAGVFGHALAEYMASSEKPAPSLGKLAGDSGLIIFLALVFSACGLCPICIIMTAPRGLSRLQEDLVAYATMALCLLCLPVVIVCLHGGGRIVVALGVECDTRYVLVLCYTSSFILFIFNFIIASEVGAVLVLGFAVFFGYFLDGWFLVSWSKPKMGQSPADDGGNKEQTKISSDSSTE